MEVIILIIVFMSLSMVLLSWYANFSSKKIGIIRKGQALFIASNALEKMRMTGKVIEQINNELGFTASISAQKVDIDFPGFLEVEVYVDCKDFVHPVRLSTGILLSDPASSLVDDIVPVSQAVYE